MISICRFNPEKDIQEVVPGLATSVAEALATGIVKDTASNAPYNKMESTDEIGHYITDPIDVALEHRRVLGILNSQAASNEANFEVANPQG